jgi:hypothetical protein
MAGVKNGLAYTSAVVIAGGNVLGQRPKVMILFVVASPEQNFIYSFSSSPLMTKPCCRKHKDFAARCGFVLAGERREDVRKEMRKE